MTIAAPPEAPVAMATTPDLAPATLDRRFYAFVLDRLLLWSLYAAAAAGAYDWFLRDERWLPGIAVIAGAVVILAVASAAVLGTWGVSAGKAALGLRVLTVDNGRPVGVLRAPSCARCCRGGHAADLRLRGVGARLDSALTDPAGRRRGWHDLRTGRGWSTYGRRRSLRRWTSRRPRPVVNLTAMRLVPPSPPPPFRLTGAADTARPRGADAGLPTTGTRLAPGGAHQDRRHRSAGQGAGSGPAEGALAGHVRHRRGARRGGPGPGGRRPEPRAGEPVRTLLALASTDMSLSKTHAQFQVVPDGALVVMDHGSTNGSVLVRGGLYKRLEGGGRRR